MTDITKTSADSYTSSGVVTNAIVNDARTSVSIYSELTNEEYDGDARTFGAWAKIDGDENDVLVIVARCGGATPTTINPAGDGVVKAFVDFTLQISAEQAQAVEASEGYYATAAALESEQDAREALAERVVTTHKNGVPDEGDDQLIRGGKAFVDGITIGSGENQIRITSGTMQPVSVLTQTRSVVLGNNQYPFNSANIRSVYANEVSASAGVFYGGMTAYGTSTFTNVIVNTRATATLLDVTTVTPHNDNSTVGTEQEYFKTAYINTVHVNTGIAINSLSADNGYISIYEDDGDLIVSSDLYLGFGSAKKDLYAKGVRATAINAQDVSVEDLTIGSVSICDSSLGLVVTGSFQPNNDGLFDLGSYDNQWRDVYAGTLHGLLETLYDSNNGVGSLTEINITNVTDGAPVSLSRGNIVFSGGTVIGKQLSVTLDGTSAPGKWALLNAKTVTNNGTKALAVRVE